MAIWGPGAFENDWTLRWVAELAASGDPDLPASMLRVFDGPDLLDLWEIATGFAASEAIAASCGRPAGDMPDAIAAWLRSSHAHADVRTVQLAIRVTGKILDQIRAVEGTEDADDEFPGAWLGPITDLRGRLLSAAPSRDTPERSSGQRVAGLLARRGEAGSRRQIIAPGIGCRWKKVPGGLVFAMGDTRRNAVTMDTRYGGRQRGLRRAGGLRRHCRLYVWGDGTGEWPGRFMVSSFCPLWPADHWDDPAPGAEGVGLVNQWIDADGDDEVIWAYLEREYEAMYTAFTSCLAARRTGAVAALRTRGRFDEAARIEDLGPEEFERRLLGSERKKIVMERERRLSGTGGRLLEGDRR